VADGAAVVRRRQLRIPSRKAWLVVAFVVVFLTFGVPRWLAGDQQGTSSPTAAQFTELCRQHGGTPHASPGAGGGPASAQQFCTIRYGATVYRMDAITAHGFDEDTAKFQRQGCVQAQSEPGHRGSFVYHAETGVCEHRP
jgi:hypothetical protein